MFKKTTDILLLREEDMKKVFTMKDAIETAKEAMKIYSEGKSNVPLRPNINVPEFEGQSLYMCGYAAPAKALGVKIVSVYPKNIDKGLISVPATMTLVNCETGQVSCLMDGTYLTKIRTGALGGAAADLLARKDAKVFALFGTGGQAESQLEAILNVRKIELVKVFDVFHDRADAFAKRMNERFGESHKIKVVSCATSDETIQDADIITTVTTAKKAVFDGEKIKPNCHINGIGSYTPEMAEVPEYVITHAGKIYVDTRDGALNESGDLIQPIKKGVFSADKVTGEIGELILGKTKGRENDDEMTFFETTGSAVLDIVTAQKIYESAVKMQIGTKFEL